MSIDEYRENYAFVASTLPIYALNNNIKKWNVEKIFLASTDLLDSYEFLTKNFPEIKIIIIPSGRLRQASYLFWWLLKGKLLTHKIYFFHECCWVIFDLLITMIKPKGEYLPQVTMNGNPIQNQYFLSQNLWFKGLITFWFSKLFSSHKLIESNSYCYVLKKYPKSISKNTISSRKSLKKFTFSNKILLVIGSEFREKNALLFLNKIIQLLSINGYECEIKDHPRVSERFNITTEFSEYALTEINPKKPIELLDDHYLGVIGLFSTALLFFGDRAISLINLMKKYDLEAFEYRKKHLFDMPGGNDIIFIDTIDEILDLFIINDKKYHE